MKPYTSWWKRPIFGPLVYTPETDQLRMLNLQLMQLAPALLAEPPGSSERAHLEEHFNVLFKDHQLILAAYMQWQPLWYVAFTHSMALLGRLMRPVRWCVDGVNWLAAEAAKLVRGGPES